MSFPIQNGGILNRSFFCFARPGTSKSFKPQPSSSWGTIISRNLFSVCVKHLRSRTFPPTWRCTDARIHLAWPREILNRSNWQSVVLNEGLDFYEMDTSIVIRTYMHICTCVYCIYIYVYIYICTHCIITHCTVVYVYVFVCIYIYIYTYTYCL